MSLENDRLSNREQAHRLFTKNKVLVSHGNSPPQIAPDYLLNLGVKADQVYALFSRDGGWKYEADTDTAQRLSTGKLIDDLLAKSTMVYALVQESLNGINWYGFNDHGLLHISRVVERVRQLTDALNLPDGIGRNAGIAAVGHDLGNLVRRDTHSLISPLMLPLIFPGLPLEATEFNAIRRGIEFHDSLIYLKILKCLGSSDGQKLIDQVAKLFGKEALLLILADKADIGKHRVNPKALNPLAIDAHPHSEYNLLFETTKLGYDSTGSTFEWDIDFNPEVNDTDKFKNISVSNPTSSTGCVFYSSKRTQVITDGFPVPDFRKSVNLFVNKYSDKVKMVLLAALALNSNTNSARISLISKGHSFEQGSTTFAVAKDTLKSDLDKISVSNY